MVLFYNLSHCNPSIRLVIFLTFRQYIFMTEFQKKVVRRVQAIPYGKVVSYGQIAESIYSPRSARQVGWVMRSLEMKADMPWWRVLNTKGIITIKGNIVNDAPTQKSLLESEGIEVRSDYTIDMDKHRYYFDPNMFVDEEFDT